VTLDEYLYYRQRVAELDPDALARAGTKTPPTDATDFALRVSYVILNSGMRWTVAKDIWDRLRPSLIEAGEVGGTFRHPGKVRSIEKVMSKRLPLFAEFLAAWADGPEAVIGFCEALPHIGGITKFHLAKNLGVDVAKPDVWLERVARKSGEDVQGLCARLSLASGDKISTVDYVIWKSCQRGWWPSGSSS
jgi:hypothetical protein